MEIIELSRLIEKKINSLEKGRNILQSRAEAKAEAIAGYDKAIALTIIKLRNGQIFDFEGEKVQDPPASLTEKISKGICWRECLAMEKAEAEYKSAISGMESLKAELNGYQSIHRFLSDLG